MRASLRVFLLLVLAAPLIAAQNCSVADPVGSELFASPQADPIVLSPDGSRLYVANTTSNSVSVIDTATHSVLVDRIRVGIDPVGLAVRPDGNELWVTNHISDSVSVIDTAPGSPTEYEVIATIQDLDANGVTRFDEPVGVAFASNTKAYVALSSRNEIAIVDIVGGDYPVSGTRLQITAQDPRAIRVRDGRLYVVAFESGNRSELSVCAFAGPPGDTQCSFGAQQILNMAGTSPNLPGVPKNIVRDPDVPDRDLFVFDTATDSLVGSAVTNVGTLLYGLAVSSTGQVFVTNTDARNADVDDQGSPDGDGLAAPVASGRGNGDGLEQLDNRIFFNRITKVDCTAATCGTATAYNLESVIGPPVALPLATPYGVAISDDDAFLVVTAAASNRIATVQTGSPGIAGIVDTLDVGDIPRGVAYDSGGGHIGTAYVLNTLGNSVSVVSVGPGGTLSHVTDIPVGQDRTPAAVRRGRIAFNSASGSSSGTFACASCHPDAHVDQLMWVIGATCDDCDQEEPRSTMPIRGLKNTLPLHWDGTLGDPFGGPNGEVGTNGSAAAVCSTAGGQQECFRHLVNASLSSVMCEQPSCPNGPSGLPGRLSDQQREDMAVFLQSVSYPPARKRPIDDDVSGAALNGFADFFMDQGGNGGSNAATCADTSGGCHALPLGTSTNSPVVGAFEAPTMRGLNDRFLQFSGGFTIPEELLDLVAALGYGVIPWDPNEGFDEKVVFSAAFPAFNTAYNVLPDDMFEMFEEAATTTSGALGRGLTLNQDTDTAANLALLDDLEAAHERGVVTLFGEGVHFGKKVTVAYAGGGMWKVGSNTQTRALVEQEVAGGWLRFTITAHLPLNVGQPEHPQPLISMAPGTGATDSDFPQLTGGTAGNPMTLVGLDVREDARILWDGQPDGGSVNCGGGGSFAPLCTSQQVVVSLAGSYGNGLHLLQLQNGDGPISNELPVCVGNLNGCE
jgi:YVTN family beta-propeller protein